MVEDEVLIADYVCDVLADAGLEVFGVAPSGEQALVLMEAGAPDLALVDVKLAGAMDGIALAEALQDRHGVASMFLTGSGDPKTLARMGRASPFARLQKPVSPEELVEALRAAARARHPGGGSGE